MNSSDWRSFLAPLLLLGSLVLGVKACNEYGLMWFFACLGLGVMVFVLMAWLSARAAAEPMRNRPWAEVYEQIDGDLIRDLMQRGMYPKPLRDFVAIDFETANTNRASACALGLVVVKEGEIVERRSWLIDPGTRHFKFTYLHGLTYADVKGAPTWPELWPEVREIIRNQHLVAHNAEFEHTVLKALCDKYELEPVEYGLVCTLELSRIKLPLGSHRLNLVCDHLGIPLKHHDAESDAEAAALVALRIS